MKSVELKKGLSQETLIAFRKCLLKVLRHKFEVVPEEIVQKIEANSSETELDRLFEGVLDAETLDEFRVLVFGSDEGSLER